MSRLVRKGPVKSFSADFQIFAFQVFKCRTNLGKETFAKATGNYNKVAWRYDAMNTRGKSISHPRDITHFNRKQTQTQTHIHIFNQDCRKVGQVVRLRS